MSGASMGCSHHRPCSGGTTTRTYRNRSQAENFVFIDVDSDSFRDVIIIDVPDSLPRKLCGPSVLRNDRKGPWATVICLDDDESTDNINANTGAYVHENVKNGASSSKRAFPVPGNFASSSDSDADDCQFVQENFSPVKLSKGKRTYSGTGPTNRYGLSADSESSSDDSDYLDVEMMEGPSGRLREQWEKASSKRKYSACDGRSGFKDPETGFCGAHRNGNLDNERGGPKETAESKEKEAQGQAQGQAQSQAQAQTQSQVQAQAQTQAQTQAQAQAYTIPKEGGDLDCSSNSKKAVVDNDDLIQSNLKTKYPAGKSDTRSSREPLNEEHPFDDSEHRSSQYFEKGGSSFDNKEDQDPCRPNSVPRAARASREVYHVEKVSQNKENISVENEPCKTQCKSPVNQDHETSIHEGKRNVSKETTTDDTSKNTNTLVNRVQPVQSRSASANEEPVGSVLNSQMVVKEDDLVRGMQCDVTYNLEGCILTEREKLKETDDYKKALEEEWASRQRALQIQAEEAQNLKRLRKRKRVEKMRLLDMEKRQKERVEEIRETQKKDEEKMNLKEVIRAAVRKELHQLELTCYDMASLLRGLGVLVGAVGQRSSPNEVRLAYKKALLTFHPDRASGSDMRKQVEAEEKFKLISRMKEKFPLT